VALTPAQQQVAALIMGIGARRGLAPPRQRELAAASYAESGLNPAAINKSSGAAGLFQLLSPGYRSRAQQLGGLTDPRANTLAIINDYVNYWKQHPGAPPGAAGRDVERSGQGAGFYSRPLGLLGGVQPGGGIAPLAISPTAPGQAAVGPMMNAGSTVRNLLMRNLLTGRHVGGLELMQNVQQAIRQRAAQAPSTTPALSPARNGSALNAEAPGSPSGGLAEAFYDPLGSWDSGRFGGPIGGHSDHVHLSITNPQTMLSAINWAQQHGLRVGENPYVDPVDPVHVKGSFHYRDFPGVYGPKKSKLGEAIDVSGSPSQMAAYYRWATSNLR
jgi:hypothetical protein